MGIVSRGCLTASLFIGACLLIGPFTYAQTRPVTPDDRLTIGPAVLTFPELARLLSSPSHPVTCTAGLQNAAAFIYLKDRSWQQTRDLLTSGLEVRIRPRSLQSSEWMLERNPDVLSREMRWRRRLAEVFQKKLMENVADSAPYLKEPYAAVLSRLIRLRHDLEEREKSDPDHQDPKTRALEAAIDEVLPYTHPENRINPLLISGVTSRTIADALTTIQPYQKFDVGHYIDLKAVLEQLRAELAHEGQPNDPDVMAGLEELAKGDYLSVYRLHFDPAFFSLKVETFYFDPESEEPEDSTDYVEIGGGGTELLNAMGAEMAKDLQVRTEKTVTFLKKPCCTQEFALSTDRKTDSLSQVVEVWSAATGKEVIMELNPYREGLFLPAERSVPQADAALPAKRKITLRKLSDEKKGIDDWSLDETDGVVIVQSLLRFLDRPRDCPLAAFLKLERSWEVVRNREGALLPSPRLQSLMAYHRAITHLQNAIMPTSYYRGISIEDITNARPAILILAGLSPAEQAQMPKTMEKTVNVLLPLRQLSQQTLQAVAASLYANLLSGRYVSEKKMILPGYLETLRGYALFASREDKKMKGESRGWYTFSLLTSAMLDSEPDRLFDMPIGFLQWK